MRCPPPSFSSGNRETSAVLGPPPKLYGRTKVAPVGGRREALNQMALSSIEPWPGADAMRMRCLPIAFLTENAVHPDREQLPPPPPESFQPSASPTPESGSRSVLNPFGGRGKENATLTLVERSRRGNSLLAEASNSADRRAERNLWPAASAIIRNPPLPADSFLAFTHTDSRCWHSELAYLSISSNLSPSTFDVQTRAGCHKRQPGYGFVAGMATATQQFPWSEG